MNTDITQIINFINSYIAIYGFQIAIISDATFNLIFKLCFSIFFLISLALLSVINICIYLTVLYISENKKVIEFFSKRTFTLKLFNLYKTTRKVFIVFELVMLLSSLIVVLYITGLILSAYIIISST